jgi:vacuolar-type H+-ATPase subunit H
MIDAEPTAPVTVLEALDALEATVAESRRLPFSSSVVVNEDELVDLIDRVRLSLPEAVVEAGHTVEDRERIIEAAEDEAQAALDRARAEADRILEEARAHAEMLVATHTVLREAESRAQALLADAESQAGQVTADADAYAVEVMGTMEKHLDKSLATIRNGMEALPVGRKRRR